MRLIKAGSVRGKSTYAVAALALMSGMFWAGGRSLAGSTTPVPGNLETCFSPGNDCDQKLISFINSAQSSLDIAIYSITLPELAKAIEHAKNRGVQVRMVVDKREAKGHSSSVSELVSAGVPLKIGHCRGIMHDKFTIVDGRMLETGSYNYSANATNNNAENQIYLTDSRVVSEFSQDFNALWSDGLSPDDLLL